MAQEGRLLTEATGDNTDLPTNIMPRVVLEALAQGYRDLISGP